MRISMEYALLDLPLKSLFHAVHRSFYKPKGVLCTLVWGWKWACSSMATDAESATAVIGSVAGTWDSNQKLGGSPSGANLELGEIAAPYPLLSLRAQCAAGKPSWAA